MFELFILFRNRQMHVFNACQPLLFQTLRAYMLQIIILKKRQRFHGCLPIPTFRIHDPNIDIPLISSILLFGFI